MLAIIAIRVIYLLSHCVLAHEEDHYLRLNEWTEDAYALDLLRVNTYSELSQIQCCALCSRDETCFGAAWNQETRTCQLASNVEVVAYVDLVPVSLWHFMVKEEFVCGTEICKNYKTSCKEVRDLGVSRSGVYSANFSSYGLGLYDVSCDMVNGGGGWMVFQRRQNGNVDFYRKWNDYANGFGSINSEFWLGNDLLHKITTSTSHQLRVDLEDFEGSSVYAEYATFSIADANRFYKLLCMGYSGTAGDSLSDQNGMLFTTVDSDNDNSKENCATLFHGAWWYLSCHECNLNGAYLGGEHSSYADGVEWSTFKGFYYSLKFTEMKIRENDAN